MFEQLEGFHPRPDSQISGAEGLLNARTEPDLREFALLLATYRDDVVHFLYRMLQDQAAAEDLSIEAFARLWGWPVTPSNPADGLETRLFRIAAELALTRLTTESAHEEHAKFAHLGRTVGCMAPRQRAAILLHKYRQMDFAQIADVLNCTEAAAKRFILSGYQAVQKTVSSM